MRNTITYTLGAIMILASMLLVGCEANDQAQSDWEKDTRPVLNSLLQAFSKGDAEIINQLMCSEMDDIFLSGIVPEVREDFNRSISDAYIDLESSKEGEIIYVTPIYGSWDSGKWVQTEEPVLGKWMIKKMNSEWCGMMHLESWPLSGEGKKIDESLLKSLDGYQNN